MKESRQAADLGFPGSSRLLFEVTRLSCDPDTDPKVEPAAAREGSFMQTAFWARFKMRTGWQAYAINVKLAEGDFFDTVYALARPLALGQWFAYVPFGPASCPPNTDPADFLYLMANSLKPYLPRRPLFIRFDIPWVKGSPESLKLSESIAARLYELKHGEAVQVPDTSILDLRPSESELLEGMKPKWRYNVRLAEKKGVTVERHGEEGLDAFYDLYLTTARRDGIAIHPKSYYARLLEEARLLGSHNASGQSPVAIWLARHEDDVLAGIITIFINRQAVYLYGASSDVKRNLMPAYALQWAAIRAAKASGCVQYDFFGIPPEHDPGHAMAGLYLFKTGFGGGIVHRMGSIDLPVRPIASAAFFAMERIRLFWHKKIVKKLASFSRSLKSSGK